MSDLPVRITRLKDSVELPTYATAGSVAFDISVIEDGIIPAKGTAMIPTGLIIATPPGYALLIAPRSSLFRKTGLRIGNTVGVIDQDFCGPEDELFIYLWNPSDRDVHIKQGDRLAQGLFVAIARAIWNEAPAEGTSRGGWGQSGGYTLTS